MYVTFYHAVNLYISGAFENGVAAGEIEEALQPISALRLVVHSDSDVWALLSEVCVLMCVQQPNIEPNSPLRDCLI